MQIKVFIIPVFDSESANEALNKFLRSHQVIEVQQEFVAVQNGAYWCFSVSYIQRSGAAHPKKRERVDYRNLLSLSLHVK